METLAGFLPAFIADHPLPYAFCFLIIFAFTLPICEEIALVLVGAAMRATRTGFLSAALVSLAAILIQDAALFAIPRIFGPGLLRRKLFSKIFKPERIAAGERYFKRRGPSVVFWTRFVAGLRAPVILGAGFLRMAWGRFAAFNALAASIIVPAWLFVGYSIMFHFGGDSGALSKILAIAGPIVVIVGVILIYRSIKADSAKIDSEERGAS